MGVGKRVLVTGAGGMLGSAIVPALIERRYDVHAVDLKRPAGWDDRHSFAEAALQDWPDLMLELSSVELVIHAAAIANLDSAPEPAVFGNNVSATSTIVYAAAEAGIKRLVYASSQSALGFSRARTVIAPDYIPVDEGHDCHLTEGYGLSKLVGEQVCRTVSYRSGMETVSLRFPVIWAPENFKGHTARRLNDPTQAAKSMWSYVDLRDAARAAVLALEADLPEPATVLNITARWPFCQDDIGRLVDHWYGAVERRAPVDAQSPVYSARRAEEVLGFRARYRWTSDGIEEMAA